MEAISDNEAEYDSDDIMGEAIYDDEYLRNRKQKRVSSSSEEDEEYRWEEENLEDEEADDSLSASDDSDESQGNRRAPTRSRRTKLRSVDELQSGLRRSKRSTRPRINYLQYEVTDSDVESAKPDKSSASGGRSDASNDLDASTPSKDSQEDGNDSKEQGGDQGPVDIEMKDDKPMPKVSPDPEGNGEVKRPRYLDLNEVAPISGFDDGPGFIMKDESKDF